MPTLTSFRQAVAAELGGYGGFHSDGGGATTITCTAAFQSSELVSSAMAYRWVFAPFSSEPRQRRITATGLNAATGTITLEAAMGSSFAGPSVPFELHTFLPAARETSTSVGSWFGIGIHESINLALRHILVPQQDLSLPLSTGQYDYPLASVAAWLDRAEWLIAVRQRNATDTNWIDARALGHDWELRESADGHILHFVTPYSFSIGAPTAQLVVRRPASTLINGLTSTSGLVAESDTAAPDLNSVVAVALAYCYKTLRDGRRGVDRAKYAALYANQVAEARKVRNYDHSNDIDPTVARQSATPATPPPVAPGVP